MAFSATFLGVSVHRPLVLNFNYIINKVNLVVIHGSIIIHIPVQIFCN